MSARKFLFIHQNFPGQFVHVAVELARRGHQVVALGIKGRVLPGVRYVRYAPRAPGRISEVEPARDFETKIVRGLACAQAMAALLYQFASKADFRAAVKREFEGLRGLYSEYEGVLQKAYALPVVKDPE